MTITTPRPTADHAASGLRPVALDLYRDIHKGIRSELFAVTTTAGSLDPADRADRAAVRDHLVQVVGLLESHAHHEDTHVGPAMHRHLPDLATAIEADHHRLDGRLARLLERAEENADAGGDARWRFHELYIELAAFTSDYLAHQDLEERVVMPGLADAMGFDEVLAIHEAIVGSIPPEEMARSLAIMVPAMNVDDRAELLGGMRAGAPAEVFTGVWELVGSVLAPREVEALATRLEL